MERRDYLEDQINQLGKVFAKIFNVLGFQVSQSTLVENIKVFNDSIKDETGISNLMLLEESNLIKAISDKHKFNDFNLEKLAEIFYTIALQMQPNESNIAKQFYSKSLVVYEVLNKQNSTYSLTRELEVAKIRKVLEQL